MARHNEILNKFKDILADGFSFENEAHKSMVRHSIVSFSFFNNNNDNNNNWGIYIALYPNEGFVGDFARLLL